MVPSAYGISKWSDRKRGVLGVCLPGQPGNGRTSAGSARRAAAVVKRPPFQRATVTYFVKKEFALMARRGYFFTTMSESLLGNSAAHGFKDYEYPLRKAPGVFRVFVLGDSVAFGQGVLMEQCFSKVLENILNRESSTTVFEVINSSVPSLNAIQEHCLQTTLGADYQPDLYLLTLCHNDAELVQPVDLKNRQEHLSRVWDRNNPAWPYFEEALKEIKKAAESHGAALVVAYLVFSHPSLAPQAPGLLSEACREFDIPFTNVGESTGHYEPEKLWVSEVETHPNELGHQVIAQHLARFLIQGRFLPPGRPDSDERALVLNLVESLIGEETVLPTEGPTFPLAKVYSLLRTKLNRPPARSGTTGRISKEEIEQALAVLSPVLRYAQTVECLDGYDTFLRIAGIQGDIKLFGVKQTLSKLAESIYFLGRVGRARSLLPQMVTHAVADPPAPDLASFEEARETNAARTRQLEALQGNLSRLSERFLRPSSGPEDGQCFLSPVLPRVAARLHRCLVAPYRPVSLFMSEAHRLGRALRRVGDDLAQELAIFEELKAEDFPDADQFRRYRHLAQETAGFFINAVRHLCSYLDGVNLGGLEQVTSRLLDGTAKSWCDRHVELEIVVNAPPLDGFRHLGMYWTDIVPLRALQRDTMAVVSDGKDHSYRFKFFIGVLGYFTLELRSLELEHVRSLRMHVSGELCREYAGDGLSVLRENGMRGELLMMAEKE